MHCYRLATRRLMCYSMWGCDVCAAYSSCPHGCVKSNSVETDSHPHKHTFASLNSRGATPSHHLLRKTHSCEPVIETRWYFRSSGGAPVDGGGTHKGPKLFKKQAIVWFLNSCTAHYARTHVHNHNVGHTHVRIPFDRSVNYTEEIREERKWRESTMHGTSMCPTTTVCLSGIDFCSFPKLRISDWPTAAGATGSTGTGEGGSHTHTLSPFLHFSAGNQWCLLNYWVNLISSAAVLTALWPTGCQEVIRLPTVCVWIPPQ